MKSVADSCGAAGALLLDFAYGELDGEQRRTVGDHLRTCPRCQAELAAIGQTRSLMADLIPEPAPEAGFESLLDYARKAVPGATPLPKDSAWRWLVPALSLASVTMVSIVLVMTRPLRPADRSANAPALSAPEPLSTGVPQVAKVEMPVAPTAAEASLSRMEPVFRGEADFEARVRTKRAPRAEAPPSPLRGVAAQAEGRRALEKQDEDRGHGGRAFAQTPLRGAEAKEARPEDDRPQLAEVSNAAPVPLPAAPPVGAGAPRTLADAAESDAAAKKVMKAVATPSLKAVPESPEALFDRAQAYRSRGELAAAEAAFARFLARFPAHPRAAAAAFLRVGLLERLGRVEEAAVQRAELARRWPDSAEAHADESNQAASVRTRSSPAEVPGKADEAGVATEKR